MQRRLTWRAGVAVGALAGLAACGGGEIVAVLGFLGSAGGSWLQDDKPAEGPREVGLQLRNTCGDGSETCFIRTATAARPGEPCGRAGRPRRAPASAASRPASRRAARP